MTGKNPRQSVSKSVRFEVFKRDSFTCQYCGDKAPDVVLQVDHITPVAAGGDNDLLNLVTACRACNSGKRDRLLSDTTAVQRRRIQAEELQEQLSQLKMISEWHLGLIKSDRHAVDLLEGLWFEGVGRRSERARLLPEARDHLRAAMKRYGFGVVCDAITQIAGVFRRTPEDERFDEDRNTAFWSIPKQCHIIKAERDDPGIGRLFYIRGILRNRTSVCDRLSLSLLKEARAHGLPLEWLESLAKRVISWQEFQNIVDAEIKSSCEAGGE